MFCQNCGNENPDGVKFCSQCGASLQCSPQETAVLNQPSVPPVPPVQPVSPVQQYSPVQPAPQSPKSNKKLGLIIGGVVGVIAIIVAIVLVVVFTGKGKDDKPVNAESNSKTTVSDVQNENTPSESVPNTTEPVSEAASYKETAQAFMDAISLLKFEEADKYSIIPPAEAFKIYSKITGLSTKDLYAAFGQGMSQESGEKYSITSMTDVYNVLNNLLEEGGVKPDITKLKIVSAKKLDMKNSADKKALSSDIIECMPGIITESNYKKFVETDDITEAYKVEFEDDSWFYVAKYQGEWRVVATSLGIMASAGA